MHNPRYTDQVTTLPVIAAGTDQGGGVGPANVIDQSVRGGEDITGDTQKVTDAGTSTYISTATTTLCKTGRGVLKRITISETAAGIITIYDNLTAAGTILGVFKASIAEQTFELGWRFSTGCTIVTAAASKVIAVTDN